jgi:anti-sigma B factor antagonist
LPKPESGGTLCATVVLLDEVVMALQCNTVMRGEVAVVYCRGRLVFGDGDDELRRVVLELLPQTRQIVLHLGWVTHVDSGGLGALVGLYVSARNRHGEIKLAAVSAKALDVLKTTKLTELFDIHPSEEAAAAAFAGGKKAASA